MNLVEEVERVAARETATQSDDPVEQRIWNALSTLPDMDASEFLRLRWFEYDIAFNTLAEAAVELEMLAWLRSLDIAAAPEAVASIATGADGCVVVSRYWACPGERLEPAKPTGPPFGEDARRRFRHDMEKLAEQGKVHPYARGFAHMLVSETSGTLL
ncbi:MAG: hypothetical protein ABIY55_30925, partial [Kofleriaceae bacterium]